MICHKCQRTMERLIKGECDRCIWLRKFIQEEIAKYLDPPYHTAQRNLSVKGDRNG